MTPRRVILFVISVLCCTVSGAQYRTDSAYASLYDSETVTSFKNQVRYLASHELAGRAPGSEGEKLAAEYVYDRLQEAGAEMLCSRSGDPFGIVRESGDTLVSRNVYAMVQGYDKKLRDRYIVVGARLDNLGVNTMTVDGVKVDQVYYGANGNASGLAMMTELARLVATNAVLFRRSVIFVAFGSSTESYAGAWYFLNRAFKEDIDKVDAMINLDMLGLGDSGFYAYTASNADMNAIIGSVASELQPIRPEITSEEPYPSDHRAFYSSEIPAVMLTTGRYSVHNTGRDDFSILNWETMERELEYTYNLTLAVANAGNAPLFRPMEVSRKVKVIEGTVSENDCDIRPMFFNSADVRQFLQRWVYEYIKYPKEAVEKGIQGTVLLSFVVEKDGSVVDVEVIRGVDPLLDNEAVRVVAASPKWKPGRIDGAKVRTMMTLPVEFRLKKGGSFGINNYRIKK